MLRFSLELLDFIELDVLIDESIDWDIMSSFDVDVFCESCFVLADDFQQKKYYLLSISIELGLISNLKTT